MIAFLSAIFLGRGIYDEPSRGSKGSISMSRVSTLLKCQPEPWFWNCCDNSLKRPVITLNNSDKSLASVIVSTNE